MNIFENNWFIVINYFCWFSGVYILAKILLKFYSLINEYVLPRCKRALDYTSYGQWAVITGSTDGIGLGYAKELASRGLDICLISRNENKLEETAKTIESTYGVKTKYIVADFTSTTVYDNIRKNLDDLDIGILVNNVGIVCERIEPFSNQNELEIKANLFVNLLSLTMMTSLVLPCMIKKKRGLIINMSSLGSEIKFPYLAVYCACKAYITTLGTCLTYELKKNNIQMTTMISGCIQTKLLNRYSHAGKLLKLIPFGVLPVDRYVKNALLSVRSGAYKTCGFIGYDILLGLWNLVPFGIIPEIVYYYEKDRQ